MHLENRSEQTCQGRMFLKDVDDERRGDEEEGAPAGRLGSSLPFIPRTRYKQG